jgi:GNAT superfamily N-acetyltransferase
MKNITYSIEHVDGYSGQDNWEGGIYLNGEIIGLIEFVTCCGELTVSNIFIREEYRRQGYGSRLIKYIKQEFPDYKYVPSMKTEDGAKFKHKDLDLYEKLKIKKIVKESLK